VCCLLTNTSRTKVSKWTSWSVVLRCFLKPLWTRVISLSFSKYQTSLVFIIRSITLHKQLVKAIACWVSWILSLRLPVYPSELENNQKVNANESITANDANQLLSSSNPTKMLKIHKQHPSCKHRIYIIPRINNYQHWKKWYCCKPGHSLIRHGKHEFYAMHF